MKVTNRRSKIKELIDLNGSVEVSSLADLLGVSMETIRRDLDIICDENDIKKIHGGAIKSLTSSTDYFFNKRINQNLADKQTIGETAASFIEDGDIIALDTGTTVLQMVNYIYNKDIYIVTNSFAVINTLTKYNISHLKGKIIFLGGEFNENSLSSCGEIAINMIKNLNITKAFISCDSFDIASGLSYHNIREASLTKELIKKSKMSYLLIDNDKLVQNSFYNIGDSSLINTIISSNNCPENFNDTYPNTTWIHTKSK